MSAVQVDQIAERVERLLVRYEELQRTNALLAEQVEVLTHERDSLKSRLSAARARVDALLERLPEIKKGLVLMCTFTRLKEAFGLHKANYHRVLQRLFREDKIHLLEAGTVD